MSFVNLPGPMDVTVIAVIVLLLLSGPFGGPKWVYGVGRRIAALQVQLGPAHPRSRLLFVLLLVPFVVIAVLVAYRLMH